MILHAMVTAITIYHLSLNVGKIENTDLVFAYNIFFDSFYLASRFTAQWLLMHGFLYLTVLFE